MPDLPDSASSGGFLVLLIRFCYIFFLSSVATCLLKIVDCINMEAWEIPPETGSNLRHFTQRSDYEDALEISSSFRLLSPAAHYNGPTKAQYYLPSLCRHKALQHSAIWRQSLSLTLWSTANNKLLMSLITGFFFQSALNKLPSFFQLDIQNSVDYSFAIAGVSAAAVGRCWISFSRWRLLQFAKQGNRFQRVASARA